MVRNILLLSFVLAAAACTDSASPGSPCKADRTCSDGLICNFQAASPVCLDPDADEDADGLNNKADLCPATPGGSNHDEDGDKEGDACDLCPIEPFSVNQKDGDGDGVAGLCDPVDSEKGDKILFFEGFGKADALTGWTLDDAAHFSVANDSLNVTVTAADPEAVATYALPDTSVSLSAFSAYRVIDAMPAGVSNASREVTTSVFDNSLAASGGRARCGANSEAGAAGTLRLTTEKGEKNQAVVSSFASGNPYRLLLQSDGPTARCVQIRGMDTAATEVPVEAGIKGGVSFSLRGVFANYDYILVVKSPTGR